MTVASSISAPQNLPAHLRHWGLYAEPFAPGLLSAGMRNEGFVEGEAIQEVLARLYFTIEEQFPVMTIVAASGMGKTQLLDYASQQITAGNRRLTRIDQKTIQRSPDCFVKLLKQNWSIQSMVGPQAVVVVDQVDQLDSLQQRELAQLTEAIYSCEQAPTLILSLTDPQSIQAPLKTLLREGLTAKIPAWKGDELTALISKRLSSASLPRSPFASAGLTRLIAESGGSPRTCLKLAQQCLLLGALKREPVIDQQLVQQAVHQLAAEQSVWDD